MFVVLKSCDKSWLLRFTFLVAKGANVGFFFLIVMLYSYQLVAAHKITVQLSNPINKTIKGCQFRDTFMVKILTEDASLNLLPNDKGFQRVSNKPALFDKPKKSYVVWQDAGYTWHKSSGDENANVIGITYARYGEELNSCLCFTTAGEKREKKWLNRRNGVTAGMVAMGSSTIGMLAHCWSGGVGVGGYCCF